MNVIPLPGCAPTPLAHYLKALGVLRLLSEQLPPEIPRPRGNWRGETFVLHTTLDQTALEEFFLHQYQPTPLVAPWNGGSGFYRKDTQEGIQALETTEADRFSNFREAIATGRTLVQQGGLSERPEGEAKEKFILHCRSKFPAAALAWLDAALVLTADGPKFPPLLGTGGNDGRLDFTNNFMQRVVELLDSTDGQPQPHAAALLQNSLFAKATPGLTKVSIGQFFPHAVGGANSTSGFDGAGLVNPWDFILMLEGSLVFAAAAVKRLETTDGGILAYPFSVRPSGFGYVTSADSDTDARCEIWMPLWEQPAALAELQQVLGEGRAQLKNRAARDGFEFSRAVVRLGVERGITAFQRYSFQPRNGLAYFATPLDRISVRRRQKASELLDDLDQQQWLDRLRRAARGDRVPNGVSSAVRQLEVAAMALCRSAQVEAEEADAVEAVLLAVAEAEAALAKSIRWTQEKQLRPVPTLSQQWWKAIRGRGASAELDLAASLASLQKPSLRAHWEPLEVEKPFATWDDQSREVVWRDAQLVSTLFDLHLRRLLLAGDEDKVFHATWYAQPSHVAAFLDGATDDQRLAQLARALSLVRFPERSVRHEGAGSTAKSPGMPSRLSVLFALPRLALSGFVPGTSDPTPRVAAILRRGLTGDGAAATRLAVQRLRASGFNPALDHVEAKGEVVRRAVAASIFPLSTRSLESLARDSQALVDPSDLENAAE